MGERKLSIPRKRPAGRLASLDAAREGGMAGGYVTPILSPPSSVDTMMDPDDEIPCRRRLVLALIR